MSITNERISIHCEQVDHEFYKRVSTGGTETPLEVPFDSMKDAFVGFACIGYRHNRYVALQKPQEITLSSYLHQDFDLPVLASLAFERLRIEKADEPVSELVKQLTTTRTIIPVVEGWANGGVEVYREVMSESGAPNPAMALYDLLADVTGDQA